MLKILKLTNFGCHESLVIHFTEGLNVFRASNEAGKSTVLKAIAYALWGARGMSTSLADTVTWGKPLTSLKVELIFAVSGKEYHIKRSNSGAELVSDGLTVTGQTETANFISALLGANAQTAQNTLFAAQKDIESALGSDASGLIETLANLGVIPQLIEKVREKHPSGATKHLEQQLESLVDVPIPQENRERLQQTLDTAHAESARSLKYYDDATTLALAMQKRLNQAYTLLANIKQNADRRASLIKEIEGAVVPDPLIQPDIEALEHTYGEAQKCATLHEAYTRFAAFDSSICGKALPESPAETLHDLRQRAQELKRNLAEVNTGIHNTDIALARSEVEGVCKVCGLEYSTVDPEHAKRVEQLHHDRDLHTKVKAQYDAELLAATARIASLEALCRIDDFNRRTLTNVVFDTNFFPAKPVWQGDVPKSPEDLGTLWKNLSEARKQYAAYRKVDEERAKKLAYRQALTVGLEQTPDLNLPDEHGAYPKDKATQTVEDAIRHEQLTATLRDLWRDKQEQVRAAQKVLNDHDASVKFAEAVNARNAEQRDSLEATIATMQKVNGLLTKLREARPLVANKLWKMLTEAVSTTFSGLRGTPTTVTRGEPKGFLIDGRPVSVFSGSTQDILALALRKTLVKVFLPNVDFLVLDEPAAGCDESREAALIASVAKAGFTQTLLVTHSGLADSFAQNLVTLD